MPVTLARKVTSTVGIAEVVPVRRDGGRRRAARLRLSAAAGAHARRRLGAGAAGERRLSGRRAASRCGRCHERPHAAPKPRCSTRCARAARQEQFLEVVSAEEAQRALRDASRSVAARAPSASRSPTRSAACSAHDVAAPIDVPPFDRSGVDGFAVRAADTAGATRRGAAPPDAQRRSDRLRPRAAARPSRPAPRPRSRPAAWCRAAPTPW